MRLTWILIGALCLLVPVCALVSYFAYRSRAEHNAHWNKLFERGNAFVKANGKRSDTAPFASPAASAAPLAVIRPGEVAEFRRIRLPWHDIQGASGTLAYIDGCLPVGEGRDLFWQGGDLFLATTPDKLLRIWTTDEPGCVFGERGTLCFDGRFAWAVLQRAQQSPRLFIADPQSGDVRELSAADDPLSTEHSSTAAAIQRFDLALAPISPGTVCAIIKLWSAAPAGNADGGATRAASPSAFRLETLEFAAPDRYTSDTIPVPAAVELSAWPVEIYALGEGTERRIVVRRGGGYPHLIVSPELRRMKTAKVAPSEDLASSLAVTQYSVYQDAIWRMGSATLVEELFANNTRPAILGTPALLRAGLPDLEEQIVLRHVPVGILVSHEGNLYIIGERCWRLRGLGPEIEQMANDPPWQFDDFLNSKAVVTTTSQNNSGTAVSTSFSISKPPPTPGRDPFVVRSAFASSVFGVLISASSPVNSGAAEKVLYQLHVRAPPETRDTTAAE